ncbi:hypothetical protein UPYG_G00262520 [Umbra pygmaea]|uniref:Golgi apparatus protein 1 n=1 Tax=Umbra pygmaea TaxID=75934 RepID=A0ABD0W9A6_UMBPY
MMAVCRRVPILLFMSIILYVHPVKGDRFTRNVIAKDADMLSDSQGGAPAPVNGAVVVPALPPRRRTSGWKLVEEAACREDLTRLCPKNFWNNNLALLECLQDKKEETEIAPDCNHLLWNYKRNLTIDPKFESVAEEVCKTTLTDLKECAAVERAKGYLVSCLVDHRSNITEYQCNQYISKMTSIVFSNYRLICGFMEKCLEDINTLHCGSISVGEKVRKQTYFDSCFKRALDRFQ